MPEKWREALKVLGEVGPDERDLRRRVSGGPRLKPGGEPGSGKRAGAAAVALARPAASFAFVWYAFRDRPADTTATQTASAVGAIDPAEVCDVPKYDPDVALLYGNEPGVEYPLAVLEGPGESADQIQGPATDALRGYIASPAARYAPLEGWRAISETDDAVTFAAPHSADVLPNWWIAGFELRDDSWKLVQEEIVEQRETPAQRGHGLSLEWAGELVLKDGAWNSTLELLNQRDSNWTDSNDAYWGEHWGLIHVFDPETGREIGQAIEDGGFGDRDYTITPGESRSLPVTLGGTGTSLPAGSYDVVACAPWLGLASPVGTLHVVDGPAAVPGVSVLTYPSSGSGMQALGGGMLTVHNGCLATGHGQGDATYIVWPQGYALVDRGDREVLIDPIGNEIAELGDEVRLGGGFVYLDHLQDAVIGGIPDECRTGGEGYFLTSGPADVDG
jgi:hypothetical protein